MAVYLANRIYIGKLNYEEVVTKYPMYKDGIDAELARLGYVHQT